MAELDTSSGENLTASPTALATQILEKISEGVTPGDETFSDLFRQLDQNTLAPFQEQAEAHLAVMRGALEAFLQHTDGSEAEKAWGVNMLRIVPAQGDVMLQKVLPGQPRSPQKAGYSFMTRGLQEYSEAIMGRLSGDASNHEASDNLFLGLEEARSRLVDSGQETEYIFGASHYVRALAARGYHDIIVVDMAKDVLVQNREIGALSDLDAGVMIGLVEMLEPDEREKESFFYGYLLSLESLELTEGEMVRLATEVSLLCPDA
ncbi:MAG TPA: hypothetical protein VLF60_02535 [Candidatus Saccharimonadales bacterium]|nr:hypothetical protein [Candidatus Saccharimonadales bacterium]